MSILDMKLFSKIILPITLLLYGCIDVGKGSATVDDLQLLSGITNQSLILSGTAGESQISAKIPVKVGGGQKLLNYYLTSTGTTGQFKIADTSANISIENFSGKNLYNIINSFYQSQISIFGYFFVYRYAKSIIVIATIHFSLIP